MMYANDSIRFQRSQFAESSRGRAKGNVLNFLSSTDVSASTDQHYIASKRLDRLHVIEIKGEFEKDWSFQLLASDCFWLHFQFVGDAKREGPTLHYTLLSNLEYRGFYSGNNASSIRLLPGKASLVMLGIQIENRAGFTSEWPLLKPALSAQSTELSKIKVGYRVQQVFEKIRQCRATPYSLPRRIEFYLHQLLDLYHQDLHEKARTLYREEIVLYQQALDYIGDHYADADISIDTIAQQLNVSVRKLYRAFEDKQTTIHSTIQTVRLYSARDLLRETDTSIDGIAFWLHFSSAKYFYKQYVNRFGHSPSKEREMYLKSKNRKK